jgi:signal transduction histidine kinase
MTRDRLIAAALLLAAWAEQVSGGREQLAVHMTLAAAMTVPIAFAARWPWLPALVASAGIVVYGAIGEDPDATGEIFGLAAAAFLAGSRMALRPGVIAVTGMSLAGALHLALLKSIADVVFIVAIFLVPPFLLGRGVQGRRNRIEELRALNRELAEQRERSAALAAEIERARITRDLESVVAASLERMVDTARRGESMTGPEAAAAFEAIRSDGAEATAELRRLLRLMH